MMEQMTLPHLITPMRIRMVRDDDAESPREWDNVGTMVCWHSRYNLGDEQPKQDPREYLLARAEEAVSGTAERWEKWNDAYPHPFGNTQAWKDYDRDSAKRWGKTVGKVLDKHYIMLELFLYNHSGITMSATPFSCPWDSGKVGIIYVSRAKACEEWGWKVLTAKRRALVQQRLTAEVQTYDDYLTGNVYGFQTQEWDGEAWTDRDSCWGFYGDEAHVSVHEHVSAYFALEQCKDAQCNTGEWVTVGDDK